MNDAPFEPRLYFIAEFVVNLDHSVSSDPQLLESQMQNKVLYSPC